MPKQKLPINLITEKPVSSDGDQGPVGQVPFKGFLLAAYKSIADTARSLKITRLMFVSYFLILVIAPPIIIMVAFLTFPTQTANFFNFQAKTPQALTQNLNSRVLGESTSSTNRGNVLTGYVAALLEPQAAATIQALRVIRPEAVSNVVLPAEQNNISISSPPATSGVTGPQGLTGNDGVKGDTGLTGPQGSPGPAGTTGATGSVGSLSTGNGLSGSVSSGNLTLNLSLATAGTTTTNNSFSGLETTSSGLSLIKGCSDNQVLSWNSTTGVWQCTTSTTGTEADTLASVVGRGATTTTAVTLGPVNTTGNVGVGSSLTVTSAGVFQAGLSVSGGLSLPNSSLSNANLQNSSITFIADYGFSTTSLGGTRTFAGANGIGTTESNGTLTITGVNASSSQKGVASFNSANFTVSNGAVNTIQDINNSATPAFAGITTTGNVGVGGSITGYGVLNGLNVTGLSSLAGLNTSGNVGLGSSLNVTSLGSFGSLSVTGLSALSNVTASSLTTTGNLGVGGSITGYGSLSGLSVTGLSSLSGLNTSGNVGLGASASVTSQLTTGSILSNGGLVVSGGSYLNTLNTTSNVGVGSSLTVSGLGVFNGGFLSNYIQTTGNMGIGGSITGYGNLNGLNVSGDSTLQGLSAVNISSSTLTTTGNVGVGGSLTTSSALVADSLQVTKSISGATLGISGVSNLSGNVGIGGTATFNSLISGLSGLTVSGSSIIQALSATNINSTTLTTTGNIGVGGSITGFGVLSGLSVTGLSSLNGLNTSGNVGIGATTRISSLLTLGGYNCAGLGNGGKLTTDALGNVICSVDNSSAAGSQTPWTSDINGGGYNLSNVGAINASTLSFTGTTPSITSGASSFSIFSGGNVGIGTSSDLYGALTVKGKGITSGITLQTYGSNLTQGLTVLDNGNVGIGTTNPSFDFQVINTANFGNVGIGKSLTVTSGATFSSFVNVSSLVGAGLTDCSNTTNSKLLYIASIGQFSCATDQASDTATFSDTTPAAIADNNTTELFNDTTRPNITPTTTAQTILVTVHDRFTGGGSSDTDASVQIYRKNGGNPTCGTDTLVGDSFSAFLTNSTDIGDATATFLDSPATTSNVVYTVCSSANSVLASSPTNNRIDVTLVVLGADLAENYYTVDDSIVAGNIVSIDQTLPAGAKKSTKAYDSQILGIVSTAPGKILDDGIGRNFGRAIPIALSGRVPVKVTAENGPIKVGDLITSSSVAGVGMKATKSGVIVGQAMTGYSGDGIGMVFVFVKNDYANGGKLADVLSGLTFQTDSDLAKLALSQLISQRGQLAKSLDLSEIVIDRLTAGLEIVTPKVITSKLATDTIEAAAGQDILMNLISDGKFVIKNEASESAVIFDSLGNATFKGTLTADKIKTNQMEVLADGGLKILSDIAEFLGHVIFKGNVNFEGETTFKRIIFADKDTAGFALIKKDADLVDVTFDKEYASTPLINVNIILTKQPKEDSQLAMEQQLLDSDIRFITSRITTKGFTIKLSKNAPVDVQFSWSALVVKDMKTFTSEVVLGVQTATPSATPSPTPEASSSATTKALTIKVNNNELGFLRVREEASTTSNEVIQVLPGQTFTVLAEKNGWYEIEYQKDFYGWVSGSYVQVQ